MGGGAGARRGGGGPAGRQHPWGGIATLTVWPRDPTFPLGSSSRLSKKPRSVDNPPHLAPEREAGGSEGIRGAEGQGRTSPHRDTRSQSWPPPAPLYQFPWPGDKHTLRGSQDQKCTLPSSGSQNPQSWGWRGSARSRGAGGVVGGPSCLFQTLRGGLSAHCLPCALRWVRGGGRGLSPPPPSNSEGSCFFVGCGSAAFASQCSRPPPFQQTHPGAPGLGFCAGSPLKIMSSDSMSQTQVLTKPLT